MSGMMGGNIKEVGKMGLCMEKGCILGKMEGCIMESIGMIKSMEMEFIDGLMGKSIMGSGITAVSMELAL